MKPSSQRIPFAVCVSAALLVPGIQIISRPVVGQGIGIPTVKVASKPYTWRNVEIVGGGFISGIIFHPKERNLIYARTDIGGAYRWNPGTKRWIPINDIFGPDDWNLFGIESIALDPNDDERVYMAVGTYTNDWAGNGAVVRSKDRGKTWERTTLPCKLGGNEDGRSMGERMAVDPRNGNVLYLGTRRNGLWRSRDVGVTWAKVEAWPAPENANGIGITFVVFGPGNAIYAGVADKTTNLYRSTDGSQSWQPVAGQPQGFFPHHLNFDPGGIGYLTYSNGPGPNGVNDGAVWKFNANSGVWTNITPTQFGTGFGYAGLALDAKRPGTLVVTSLDRWAAGDDAFRSTDGGVTWKSVRENSERNSSVAPYLNWGKPQADFGHWIGDIEIDPFDSNHALYVTGATMWGINDLTGTDTGKTTHWTPRAAGIEETAIKKLISPPEGAHLVSAMADIGGFRHDDLAVSPRQGMFSNPTLVTTTGLDFAQLAPGVMARVGYANGPNKHGGYSLDGGRTWTPFETDLPVAQGPGEIAVSADGQTFVWTPEKGQANISRNRGATWVAATGLPDGVIVKADRVNASKFYGVDAKTKTLFASVDGGTTFTAVKTGLPEGYGEIELAPGREGEIWLSGSGGLQISRDGGQSFTPIATLDACDAIGFGKAAPGRRNNTLFIAGKISGVSGVFRSVDDGTSWVRVNDDNHQWGWLGASITGDPRVFGRVFIATNGRGIIWGEPK